MRPLIRDPKVDERPVCRQALPLKVLRVAVQPALPYWVAESVPAARFVAVTYPLLRDPSVDALRECGQALLPLVLPVKV